LTLAVLHAGTRAPVRSIARRQRLTMKTAPSKWNPNTRRNAMFVPRLIEGRRVEPTSGEFQRVSPWLGRWLSVSMAEHPHIGCLTHHDDGSPVFSEVARSRSCSNPGSDSLQRRLDLVEHSVQSWPAMHGCGCGPPVVYRRGQHHFKNCLLLACRGDSVAALSCDKWSACVSPLERLGEQLVSLRRRTKEQGRPGYLGVWRVNTKRPAVATTPHCVATRVNKL
jgi:hypothetical protein